MTTEPNGNPSAMTSDEFRAHLKRLGMKQTDFSRYTGISERQIKRYASGEAVIPLLVEVYLQTLVKVKDIMPGKK